MSQQDLIHYLRQLGFDGPHAGGKHESMARGGQQVIVPNPHRGDIGRPLLMEILRRAGVSRAEWEEL